MTRKFNKFTILANTRCLIKMYVHKNHPFSKIQQSHDDARCRGVGRWRLGFCRESELRAVADSALVGKTETVVSVDNTALLNIDLAIFDPTLVITAVSEDTGNYYVSYIFNTIAVSDGAWRNAAKDGTLTVSKDALGGASLEAYVSKELGEVARAEIAF